MSSPSSPLMERKHAKSVAVESTDSSIKRSTSPPPHTRDRRISQMKTALENVNNTVSETIQATLPLISSTTKFKTFGEIELETTKSPYFGNIVDRFSDSERTLLDSIAYRIENAISANDSVKFYVLLFIAAIFWIFFVFIWRHVAKGDKLHDYDLPGVFFMIIQVLLSSGFDGTIVDQEERVVFLCVAIVGVTLIAILIGLITDSVNDYMGKMSDGSSKVVEEGHTLILGWNEASTRATCQIAFLRQVLRMQNESWIRRLLPWTRIKPSTPVAFAPIVILTSIDKSVLEQRIREAFDERNIPQRYTEVGKDVVVRQGDPTNAHDLVRVAAHHATSILIMMTAVDEEEQEASIGTADNSATIRTVLALRNVVYSNGNVSETFPVGLRVIVQLSKPCLFLEESTFVDPNGVSALYPQELSRTVNSLLFFCAAKPGLSRVIMDVLDFQTASLRCRSSITVKAGPNNEMGWCVGKTIKQVLLDNCWDNAICMGCDDDLYNVFDGDGDSDGTYNTKFAAGIMGDPDRIVKDTDMIIFLSESSTPKVTIIPEITNFKLGGENLKLEMKEHKKSIKEIKHVLICGWRQVWDDDPKRIKERLADLYSELGKGSTVTFATRKARNEFNHLIMQNKSLKFKIKEHNWIIDDLIFDGLEIRHFECDPVKINDMERLFSSRTFQTAIVLGTASGLIMPDAARDSRVLTILLILRRVSKLQGQTLHVVAENQQDQTSTLAVVPRTGNAGYEPDFINTQAIIARTLVLNLAYPQIQDAVSELITNKNMDAPNFDIFDAENLGLVGVTTNLGSLRQVLGEKYNYRAIGIGWFYKNEMTMCPPLSQNITFTKDHRVVVVVRLISDNLPTIEELKKKQASPNLTSYIKKEENKDEDVPPLKLELDGIGSNKGFGSSL